MNRILLYILIIISTNLVGQISKNIEIPISNKKDTITNHFAYSVSYNHKFRQANWVAYQLTKMELIKIVDRSDKFIPDPSIKGTDNAIDYKGSGFDRGHLAPAADMRFSETAMKESFYFSNMTPQNPSFNRGIWNSLEEKTRKWTEKYDSLYIVAGPILSDSLSKIGIHQIAIPKYFFKVILDNRNLHPKAIAFLILNEGSKEDLQKFVISIDELERISGYNFFSQLPDDIENQIEKKSCYECWENN